MFRWGFTEANPFCLLCSLSCELRVFSVWWMGLYMIPGAGWAPRTVSLYSFQMCFFPRSPVISMCLLFITQLNTICRSAGFFFCSTPSMPVFQPVISTWLGFLSHSPSSPNSGRLVDSTSVPSSCFVAWKFSQGGDVEHSSGSLHLFLEYLSFTAWSPLTWKSVFNVFFFLLCFCLFQVGR